MYYRLATALVAVGLALSAWTLYVGSNDLAVVLVASVTLFAPFLVVAAVLWGIGDILAILRAQFGDIDRRTDTERSHDAAMQRVQERSDE